MVWLKRIRSPASALVLVFLMAGSGGPAAARQNSPDEVRGLWVLRSSLVSPAKIQDAVRAAEGNGFNTLLVEVRGRGEAYYQSAIEPRASDLDSQPPAFDPLAMTLDLAHRAGLRVHAWVNIDLVSGAATLPRSRDHVVLRHPDWLMVPRPLVRTLEGEDVRSPGYVGQLARWTRGASASVEGLYLSPIPLESQNYTTSVVQELVSRYALDGIHFDYARYPGEIFDYSPRALADFRTMKAALLSPRERQRLDEAAVKDPAAWADAFSVDWAAFRRARLSMLVRRLRTTVKSTRPAMIVSAAVSPDSVVASQKYFQDWADWASTGLIDILCPTAYSTDLGEFSQSLERARASAGAVPLWAGIGTWQLPPARTIDHVRAARKAGVSGLLLFSYDALTSADVAPTAYLSSLRQALLGIQAK